MPFCHYYLALVANRWKTFLHSHKSWSEIVKIAFCRSLDSPASPAWQIDKIFCHIFSSFPINNLFSKLFFLFSLLSSAFSSPAFLSIQYYMLGSHVRIARSNAFLIQDLPSNLTVRDVTRIFIFIKIKVTSLVRP